MSFKEWKERQLENLIIEAKEQGLNGIAETLLRKGIARAIDERYNKKDQKETVIEEDKNLALKDFQRTGKEDLQELRRKLTAHGLSLDAVNGMNGKALRATLKLFE